MLPPAMEQPWCPPSVLYVASGHMANSSGHMANSVQAPRCLVASLTVFAITHGAMCAALLFHSGIAVGILFGCLSLACVALTLHLAVQVWGQPPSSPRSPMVYDSSQQEVRDESGVYENTNGDSDVLDGLTKAIWAGQKVVNLKTWWVWCFVAAIAAADVLWALCGLRSFWFVILLAEIPKGMRGPVAAALVVTLLASTAVLTTNHALSLPTSSHMPRPPTVLQVGAQDAGCALLPGLLLLAQVFFASSGVPGFKATNRGVKFLMSPPREKSNDDFISARIASHNSLVQFNTLNSRRYRHSVSKRKPLRYSVSTPIASGGFSEVFLGLSHDTGELICVKQLKAGLDESAICVMESEVVLLRSLSHPNIVQYLGTDRSGQRFTILLGYVPGGSISMLLSQFGPLQEEVTRLYIRQALSGLEYLHSEGIVHGDIKAANILVSDRGEVKLTDFGCSYSTRITENRELAMGTVLWMAPEVCRQEASNWSCDIWSLGCTLLQIATNREPWSEMEFEHCIPAFFHIATCTEPPRVPDTLPRPMQDVVAQCLQLDAARRPTCTELLAMPWLRIEQVPGEHWDSPRPSMAMESPRWARLQHVPAAAARASTSTDVARAAVPQAAGGQSTPPASPPCVGVPFSPSVSSLSERLSRPSGVPAHRSDDIHTEVQQLQEQQQLPAPSGNPARVSISDLPPQMAAGLPGRAPTTGPEEVARMSMASSGSSGITHHCDSGPAASSFGCRPTAVAGAPAPVFGPSEAILSGGIARFTSVRHGNLPVLPVVPVVPSSAVSASGSNLSADSRTAGRGQEGLDRAVSVASSAFSEGRADWQQQYAQQLKFLQAMAPRGAFCKKNFADTPRSSR